ncbi:MAG: GntR family transcriptional regulator [Phycisphaeraceae bacterium]|nr:GntR family transcriptional regulator [Phycisphaeraceae bacterium]
MSSAVKLRDRAYSHIRQKLIDGHYASGSMLNVVTLAKEIGVSRTPVAEALHRLELEHVVEQIPHVGAVVRQPSFTEITELFDLRELLEGFAAARAAEQIDEHTRQLLQQILKQTHQVCLTLRDSGRPSMSPEEIRHFITLDMAFHSIILRAGVTARHVHKMLEDLRVYMLIFFTRRHDSYSLMTVAEIYLWHSRIFNAISQRNADAAREVMSRHIRYSRDGSLKYLRRHPGEISPVIDADIASLLPQGWQFPGEQGSNDNNRPSNSPPWR